MKINYQSFSGWMYILCAFIAGVMRPDIVGGLFVVLFMILCKLSEIAEILEGKKNGTKK